MQPIGQERLVAKEVSLGTVREIPPPTAHMGLSIAPWYEAQSDDFFFQYITPEVDGLAPARAEDAESELAQKDDTFGLGRASIVDWAIKDHYDASDVTRYREFLEAAEKLGGSFPMAIGSMTEDFASKLARHERTRKRKLDNRIEWMIFQALATGAIAYNDGKIVFNVSFGRPGGQTNLAPAGGLWNTAAADPLGDVIALDELAYTTYSIHFGTAIASRRVWRSLLTSDKWAARSGMTGGTGGKPVDPNYLIDGWGMDTVLNLFERQTGIKPIAYDAVYRTRAIGSTTTTNNRFLADDKIIFLPRDEYIDELSDTEIGFAKTVTAPHAEGGFTPGFYEWEKEGRDPWGTDKGTGVKAFPIFPHLELTWVMDVL